MATETRACRICGCTDDDCSQCVEKTGAPCCWVEADLCSACVDDAFLADVTNELARARAKFPDSVCSLAALTEEVGELAQACLKVAAGKWPKTRIREEAVQVAVMAARVALEGDRSLRNAAYAERK